MVKTKVKLPAEENLNLPDSYWFDVSANNRCPEPVKSSEFSMRTPEEQHKVMSVTSAKKTVSSGA